MTKKEIKHEAQNMILSCLSIDYDVIDGWDDKDIQEFYGEWDKQVDRIIKMFNK